MLLIRKTNDFTNLRELSLTRTPRIESERWHKCFVGFFYRCFQLWIVFAQLNINSIHLHRYKRKEVVFNSCQNYEKENTHNSCVGLFCNQCWRRRQRCVCIWAFTQEERRRRRRSNFYLMEVIREEFVGNLRYLFFFLLSLTPLIRSARIFLIRDAVRSCHSYIKSADRLNFEIVPTVFAESIQYIHEWIFRGEKMVHKNPLCFVFHFLRTFIAIFEFFCWTFFFCWTI